MEYIIRNKATGETVGVFTLNPQLEIVQAATPILAPLRRPVGRPRTSRERIPANIRLILQAAGSAPNIAQLARMCNLSRPTIYKYLRVLSE